MGQLAFLLCSQFDLEYCCLFLSLITVCRAWYTPPLYTYTWFVPKVSVLIFYLNVYWTHLKLQVISFKV